MREGEKYSISRNTCLAMSQNELYSAVMKLNATPCVAFFQGVAAFLAYFAE